MKNKIGFIIYRYPSENLAKLIDWLKKNDPINPLTNNKIKRKFILRFLIFLKFEINIRKENIRKISSKYLISGINQ